MLELGIRDRIRVTVRVQWRRQGLLLQGGEQIWKLSWGTHGGVQGRVQQLLDD